jgi:DoxX-like family
MEKTMERAFVQPDSQPATISKGAAWTGRVLSGLVILFFAFDSVVKLAQANVALEGTARLGYPKGVVFGLGVVQLLCAVLYAIPRTSILGAILLTGYLGGATATHVRVSEPFIFPIVFGVVVWLGLYLRDARLRALVPLRD